MSTTTTATVQESYESLVGRRGVTRARRFSADSAKAKYYRESRSVRFRKRHEVA
jgi:hypothetical protein